MDLALPDTRLAETARALVDRAAPRAIVHHSVRAYLLGRAFARARSITFDDEGLYLAALFHDLGLVAPYEDRARAFPIASGRALRLFLRDHGVDAARIGPLVDAIELHMSLRPRWSQGAEVGLLQIGAWADATGRGRRALGETAREIARAWPRDGFDRLFPLLVAKSIGGPSAALDLVMPGRAKARR
jgi:hypothetical protein